MFFGTYINNTWKNNFQLIVFALIISGNPISLTHDYAARQLYDWSAKHPRPPPRATDQNGIPVPSLTATLGIGRYGPLLLQDENYIQHITDFTFQRIPERIVHAKGAGAFGYFEVTHDITQYTRAALFSHVGKKTPVVVRLSTVVGELGSADTVNDLRGFAVKFKTEDGNWDLMMINTPNFGIRDPILFPHISISRKRNPATHLSDYNQYWDFTANRPETNFQTLMLFSDFGFPKTYRHMKGFGVNTFKMSGGQQGAAPPVFVKFHMTPDAGIKYSTFKTYKLLAGSDPDYMIRDLYNKIGDGEYPTYTLGIQVMRLNHVKDLPFNPFDPTQVFPLKDYPILPVGRLVLNRNPKDYFNDVEQAAFHVGNLVPGIEASGDRVLHGRMLAYPMAQKHRLGFNFKQLPVNRPLRAEKVVHTYMRDGVMNIYGNGDGGPNYFPNSFGGPRPDPAGRIQVLKTDGGPIDRIDLGSEDNFSALDAYWKDEMKPDERTRAIRELARHLSHATRKLQHRVVTKLYAPVNKEIEQMLRKQLAYFNTKNQKKKLKSKRKKDQKKKILLNAS